MKYNNVVSIGDGSLNNYLMVFSTLLAEIIIHVFLPLINGCVEN